MKSLSRTALPHEELLGSCLADVSRAFYLSMRILPLEVRVPIGAAYLLARAADTLADNPALQPTERLQDLNAWAQIISSQEPASEYQSCWEHWASYGRRQAVRKGLTAGEVRLLERLPQVYTLYQSLDPYAKQQVALVVETLIKGMQLDLSYFPGAFRTLEQIEDYTYLVAGCVGQFWSRITSHYLRAISPSDLPLMEAWGVEFGKALQYVNILRDLPRDLTNGRAYIPGLGLERVVGDGQGSLDIYKERLYPWVERALEHFYWAWRYIQKTPWRAYWLRLATIWPVAIGLGTLYKLVVSPQWPSFQARIKVSRRWVYLMMGCTLLIAWSNWALELGFQLLAGRILIQVERALAAEAKSLPGAQEALLQLAPT